MVASRLAMLPTYFDLSATTRILDIGSWHLHQSIELSNIFPHAQIDAFEPVPDSFEICMRNLENIAPDKKMKIRVHNIALGDKIGLVPFFAVDTSVEQRIDAGFSSLFKFSESFKNDKYYGQSLIQKELRVQSNTLDNWCRDNNTQFIDIIWIDVQGAELLVFEGGKEILQNTKFILTEVGLKPYYEGHTLKADIDKLLFGLGFEEIDSSFVLNGFDYEANTIYVNKYLVSILK